MSVTTSTSTSGSGSTTTIGATVRDGGPTGGMRVVDVHLLIEPSKRVYAGLVHPTPTDHDVARSSVYWQDVLLYSGTPLTFKYRIKPSVGARFEGAVEGILVVSDRTSGEVHVKRFPICICPPLKSLPIGAFTSASAKKKLSKRKSSPRKKPARRAR